MKHIILLLPLILIALNINSQQWMQTSGPGGGNIRDIEPVSGFLFAACNPGGVFRSTDNGINWQPVNSFDQFFFREHNSITYNNGILFAGHSHGVMRSTNFSESWTRVIDVFDDVRDMTANGNKVFAGSIRGMYVSSDNGVTWDSANNGLVNVYVLCLENHNSLVLAGTLGGGVFISNNLGLSWSPFNNGLTNLFINDIESFGGNLFTATAGGGIFKSTDNGLSWFSSSSGINGLHVLSISGHNTNLFASDSNDIYISTNNGVSWSMINNWLPAKHVTNSLQSANGFLFAGFNGYGIYRSSNEGSNWLRTNDGLAASDVSAMAGCSRGLLAGAYRRIFLSEDNGLTWQPTGDFLNCTKITSFTVNNGDIYAGTSGCGVYLSTDVGNTWSIVNNGLTSQKINDMSSNGNYVLAGTENGIFYTTNRGQVWTSINNGLNSLNTSAILCLPGEFYVSTNSIYKSTNNGTSWFFSGTGLPQNIFVNEITFHNGNLYAASEQGVYVSTNNGLTWILRNNGIQYISAYSVKGINNNIVVSGFPIGRMYYSSDAGLNWNIFNNGFPTYSYEIFSSNSYLFSGSVDGGVFKIPESVIGIQPINGNIPGTFMLYQNYPNPFNPETKIFFDIPVNDFIELKVYDMLGREISTFVHRQLQAGKYEVIWDGSGYPSGVYFYALKSGKFTDTKKMILIK